jgi:hypothetical protein
MGKRYEYLKYPELTVLRPLLMAANSFWGAILTNIQRPCKKCYIVALQADLQYDDGRSAHISEGTWFHHVILATTPSGRQQDWLCSAGRANGGGPAYRFFSSGNERTIVRLNSKDKYGLYFPETEMFHLGYELINQSNRNETYYIAIVRFRNCWKNATLTLR